MSRQNWTGQAVRIKKGWDEERKRGAALAEPFKDRYGQFWVALEWDDEDDPTCYKRACLEFAG